MAQNKNPNSEAYATICGTLGLILGILGFIIPVYGVLYATTVAAMLGVGAAHGRSRGLAIAIVVLVILNCLISPAWWVAVAAGEKAGINVVFAWISIAGAVGSLLFVSTKHAT